MLILVFFKILQLYMHCSLKNKKLMITSASENKFSPDLTVRRGFVFCFGQSRVHVSGVTELACGYGGQRRQRESMGLIMRCTATQRSCDICYQPWGGETRHLFIGLIPLPIPSLCSPHTAVSEACVCTCIFIHTVRCVVSYSPRAFTNRKSYNHGPGVQQHL